MVAEQQSGEARYRLLETVRQYAMEKLEENGEAERVGERHARYYLALAEEAEKELRGHGAWLGRRAAEHANFRADLGWALAPDDAEGPAGARTAGAQAGGRAG